MFKLAGGLDGLALPHRRSIAETRREHAWLATDTAPLHDDSIGNVVVQESDAEHLTWPKPLNAARRTIVEKPFELGGAALDAKHAILLVSCVESHTMRLGKRLTVAAAGPWPAPRIASWKLKLVRRAL